MTPARETTLEAVKRIEELEQRVRQLEANPKNRSPA
jgi:hypothetical protein